jgi:hypothetical protein
MNADSKPMGPLRVILRTLRAWPGFSAAVLITLAAAAFNGLMVALMALRLDALLPGVFAQMDHFTDLAHRTHDLAFSFLFVPPIVGVVAQLRQPSKNVAGMLMALIPSGALLLTVLLTLALYGNVRALQPPWLTVMAGALMATVLHPAGGDLFRFIGARANRLMIGLVMVAAAPLLVFAAINIRLQGTVLDDHAAAGHYGFMAALSIAVIGVALLAGFRPQGWRLAAWVAGLLPVLLGLTSVVYPAATSSLGLGWALAAIAWGVAFVTAAELARRETPAPLSGRP